MGERGLAGNGSELVRGWRRRIWRQEGYGGRRPAKELRRRQRSEPGGSRSGDPEPPGDWIWRPPPRGDHRRPPPILRDEEDPPEISRIRQGWEGGAVARGWPTTGGEASVALVAGRRGEAPAEVEV
uniref:Uncharacterized protein n=1 Tax=Oryza rufipogon TaxID=4529 RepID=A0A0E0QQQ7_ORYRU